MNRILVLADDMTGALEVGAVFASSGLRAVVVALGAKLDVQADVLVVDTESRHSTPSDAFGRILEVIPSQRRRFDFVYKKTDSTLRGNIRSELNALSRVFPTWTIGYAPAYPAQGRTVIDGIVHVHGVPVSSTAFAHDELNPVSNSSIRDLIGPDLRCTVFDGLTDSDVGLAADTILADATMRIAAGPAALAAALAGRLGPQIQQKNSLPSVQTCFVLNGSRTEIARSQVLYARERGCVEQRPSAGWTLVEPHIAAELAASPVASARAEHLIGLLDDTPTDGVLIIGGDTAHALVVALGNPLIVPIGEVLPGLPICRISQRDVKRRLPAFNRDLILLTKAGAFGGVDVLCRARQILEQHAG